MSDGFQKVRFPMLRIHASVATILIGLNLLYASPVSAQTVQQVPQTQAPIILPAEFRPDLVVTVAGNPKAVCTAQGTVTVNIVATVKNQSPKGTADLSKIPWHIIVEVTKWWDAKVNKAGFENPGKQTVKPQVGGPAVLKPGQSFTVTLTVAGLPKFKKGNLTGQYGFHVTADPLKGVLESNEGNNQTTTLVWDPCL
jgi:hypothetical protein